MDDGGEHIILVDATDNEVGISPKLDGHRQGLLHRALSVVVRDPASRPLLQKRHIGKYHSGGSCVGLIEHELVPVPTDDPCWARLGVAGTARPIAGNHSGGKAWTGSARR
jgi:hypothetical protein